MKTQLLILIFSIASLSIFASGTPSVNAEKNKTLIVQTNAWKSAKVDVQIKDASGVTILEESLVKNKSRKYNLKNLPNGHYTLEMSDDLRITTQSFHIVNNEVLVVNDINTIYKPVIFANDNNVDINLMTLGKSALLNITDRNNNIVFAQKLKSTAVNKRFDVTSLASGTYTMNIAIGGRSFSHEFTK